MLCGYYPPLPLWVVLQVNLLTLCCLRVCVAWCAASACLALGFLVLWVGGFPAQGGGPDYAGSVELPPELTGACITLRVLQRTFA